MCPPSMQLTSALLQRVRRTERGWKLTVAVIIFIFVVLVVLVATLIPKKSSKRPAASVILPLYIYPHDNSSWRAAYDALELRPNLTFTVIVNPNSGPGDGPVPDQRYIEAVTELSSYPNAKLLGYVRTGYATRNIVDVLDEIAVYAGWSANNSALAMHGIFLDEAPYEYSEGAVEFMHRAGQSIKNATGLRDPRTTVHNPGTIPDARFDATKPDITVVFEDDYVAWQARREAVAALPPRRSAYSLMINSVPAMNRAGLTDFVGSLADLAEHLFITTNRQDFYGSLPDSWVDFVKAVPGSGS